MKKKFLGLLLVVLMVTVFTGCKQEPNQSENVPENEDKQNVALEKVEAVDVKKSICLSPMG